MISNVLSGGVNAMFSGHDLNVRVRKSVKLRRSETEGIVMADQENKNPEAKRITQG
jgi:ATP-dependent RNA circularization protein (DNA/RNA ligase family)